MTRAGFSLGLLLTAAGLLCLAAEVGTTEKDAAEAAGLVIGEPIREGNLTIFPVSTRTAKLEDRFITLDEGLRSGKVEILEVGAVAGAGNARAAFANQAPLDSQQIQQLLPDSRANENDEPTAQAVAQEAGQQAGQVAEPAGNEPAVQQQLSFYSGNDVNRLMVVNRSEKPLYLMPGEVIVGGDQDRTIGRELVIAPTGKPTPISVFCVEHGRWGSRDVQQYAGLLSTELAHTVRRPMSSENVDVDSAAESVALAEIATTANSGKFIGSIGSLNKGARLAVQKGEGQSEVWNQVSMQNAASGVQPASGAFTENYASQDVVTHLDRYQDELEGAVAETDNIVGVIVAVNGKVESMDVFESTPLFKKLWPKLLKSYALDALKADDGRTTHKQLSRGDARYFMNDVAAARAKEPADEDAGLATVQGENDRVLLFSAHERRPNSEATISLSDSQASGDDLDPMIRSYGGLDISSGGFGGVHTSAFSK